MQSLTPNPDLCPTHGVTARLWCDKCAIEYYIRLNKIKERAIKLKRIWHISRYPNEAKLFEGL